MNTISPRLSHLGLRAVVTTVLFVLVGCGESEITVTPNAPPPAPPPPAQAATPETTEAAAAPTDYQDSDFVENERNRDPFRSYITAFVARPAREQVQRDVIMSRTSIDEMRLIAIVDRIPRPTAMLLDQEGVGHTVHRGDYIGRPETLQVGGVDGVSVSLNWRVERVRVGRPCPAWRRTENQSCVDQPGEVVLSREDPTVPGRPAVTRVIPLESADGQ